MVTATRSLLGRERRGQREGLQDQRRVSDNSLSRVRLYFFFCILHPFLIIFIKKDKSLMSTVLFCRLELH